MFGKMEAQGIAKETEKAMWEKRLICDLPSRQSPDTIAFRDSDVVLRRNRVVRSVDKR